MQNHRRSHGEGLTLFMKELRLPGLIRHIQVRMNLNRYLCLPMAHLLTR